MSVVAPAHLELTKFYTGDVAFKKSNKENISVSSFREREKLECQRVLSAQQKNKAKNMNEI